VHRKAEQISTPTSRRHDKSCCDTDRVKSKGNRSAPAKAPRYLWRPADLLLECNPQQPVPLAQTHGNQKDKEKPQAPCIALNSSQVHDPSEKEPVGNSDANPDQRARTTNYESTPRLLRGNVIPLFTQEMHEC